MIDALIFWALALYGAMTLVLQVVKRLQRRKARKTRPVSLVLVVQDAESEIEGVIRTLIARFSLIERPTSVHVIDMSVGGETGHIVRRMAMLHPELTYERVESDEALADRIKQDCLDQSSIGYVYDLRVRGMYQDVASDIASILQ